MSASSPLDRLAALHGIAASYRDMNGRTRAASDETKRALLAAMGVAASSEAEIADSLRAALAPAALLPKGLVIGCEAPALIPVNLPRADAAATVTWRLRCEDGTTHEGRSVADAAHGTALALGVALPPGDHEIELSIAGRDAVATVTAAPETCVLPEQVIGDRRAWGVSAQLYGLRSARNWGIGDFDDLAALARGLANRGADFVGVNPLHALFPADPNHFGPYAPSNRSMLNVLAIAVDALEDFAASEPPRRLAEAAAQSGELAALRDIALVDYVRVSTVKLGVLEEVWRGFRAAHLEGRPTARGQAFRRALDERPEMARHALFDALHEHFFGRDPRLWSWRGWPAPYRDCGSEAVARFARDHRVRVEFFAYLQWLAEQQLAEAQKAAKSAGMAIGVYGDLAVGADPGGSVAWGHRDILAVGASIGAPPDDFNPHGQSWGLAPLAPKALRDSGYAPFRAALQASMRHAGALRIDHAMGLWRLYWVPEGAPATEGTYVDYPRPDMVRLVALESRRAICLVIGEDLGTVPEGFRAAMHDAGILSYRVLWFERDAGAYRPPHAYPDRALATASTHDLPTVAGFLCGRDIDWRERLGLLADDDDGPAARARRAQEVAALRALLVEAGALDAGVGDGNVRAFVAAVHEWLARAPSRLFAVQLDDLCLEIEQANLPGTMDEHPNWCRKLALTIDALLADPEVRALLARIDRARSNGSGA